MMASPSVHRRVVAVTSLIVGILSLFFSLTTYTFSNDHFGRISPGRQIARYGELPFRDFLDPGYFLTELASAAVQRVFGDNLLGEMLLTSSCVAAGAVVILWLVRRATGSMWLGVVTAGLAVLAFRRPYDYDKFLFYPLGLFACCRYADRRRGRDLAVMAAVAVVAGLFRYDNGVFLGVSDLAAVAAVHRSEPLLLVRRAAQFLGASLLLAAPYILFLQLNSGVGQALEQMTTYARREGARTRIGTLPGGAFSELKIVPVPPRPPDRVQIRWAAGTDQDRAGLEARFTLHNGVVRGEPEERTWLYEIRDATPDNLRTLVNEPRVADTSLVDRRNSTLFAQEGRLRRLWRHLPLLGRRMIEWSSSGAAAATYYAIVSIVLGAVWIALRSRGVEPSERAQVMSAAVLTMLAVAFILREPLVSRIGGVIGPPIVLAAWIWHRCARHRVLRLIVAVPLIAMLAIAAEWRSSIDQLRADFGHIGRPLREAMMSPSPPTILPKPRLTGLVDYLRRCTESSDRIFAAWFVPELYFFSGRAFAGGMTVTFGEHWSEPRSQRRIVEKLKTESVPVVLIREGDDSFARAYPIVVDYLRANYRMAGSSAFGETDAGSYTVLTRTDHLPVGIDPVTSMPCFARPAAT